MMKHHSSVDLDPDPNAGLTQEPEDGETALSCFKTEHHSTSVQSTVITAQCVREILLCSLDLSVKMLFIIIFSGLCFFCCFTGQIKI